MKVENLGKVIFASTKFAIEFEIKVNSSTYIPFFIRNHEEIKK